jgi:hypothetical protein
MKGEWLFDGVVFSTMLQYPNKSLETLAEKWWFVKVCLNIKERGLSGSSSVLMLGKCSLILIEFFLVIKIDQNFH